MNTVLTEPENARQLPSLIAFDKIFNILKKLDRELTPFLPLAFQTFAPQIQQIQGNPMLGLIGGMVDCASGLFLYAMGGQLAKSFTRLSALERYTLAASPMILGGCLRIWSASQSDQGKGKQTILQLLSMSILGVIGHIIMLSLDINLSQISTQDPFFYLFLFNNILTGIGIATYSAGMALGAQAAPQDGEQAWLAQLQTISETLEIPIQAGFLEKTFAPILRASSGEYLAIIACTSNFAPGLTLLSAYFLIPQIGLRNTYIFFATITSLGMLNTYYCVQDSILDQLKRLNPSIDKHLAHDIAEYMGQKIFPLEEHFFQRLQDLNPEEKSEIFKATFDYTLTFGLLTALTATGSVILENKGASSTQALLTIAGTSMLSSLMRGLMTLSPNFIKTEDWMLLSLIVMFACSIILKFSEHLPLIQTNMLVFGVFNGIGNYCVVDRVSKKIPQDIGLATGISSGLAAFLAFPISILLAKEELGFMLICFLGLGYHAFQRLHPVINRPHPIPNDEMRIDIELSHNATI